MKRILLAMMTVAILWGAAGCTDLRGDQVRKSLPTTIQEMEQLDRKELARLPDVKVPAGVSLDAAALAGKNKVQLRLMRNSIFARYGYRFTTPWIRDYFETRPWYRPGKFDLSMLSDADRENVRMLQEYEKKIGHLSPFDGIETMGPEEMKALPDIRAVPDRPIDRSAIRYMTEREVKILKNSIFAAYGREFQTPWLQKYFDSRSWYKKGSFQESMLTRTDRENVNFLLQYESARGELSDRQVVAMGYCERESAENIERFVFTASHSLRYTVESQNPYVRSTAEQSRTGEWRIAGSNVEYRLAGKDWEAIQLHPEVHVCR